MHIEASMASLRPMRKCGSCALAQPAALSPRSLVNPLIPMVVVVVVAGGVQGDCKWLEVTKEEEEEDKDVRRLGGSSNSEDGDAVVQRRAQRWDANEGER